MFTNDGQEHVIIRISVCIHIAFLLLWVRTNAPKFIRTNSFVLVCAHPLSSRQSSLPSSQHMLSTGWG